MLEKSAQFLIYFGQGTSLMLIRVDKFDLNQAIRI